MSASSHSKREWPRPHLTIPTGPPSSSSGESRSSRRSSENSRAGFETHSAFKPAMLTSRQAQSRRYSFSDDISGCPSWTQEGEAFRPVQILDSSDRTQIRLLREEVQWLRVSRQQQDSTFYDRGRAVESADEGSPHLSYGCIRRQGSGSQLGGLRVLEMRTDG